MAQTLVKDFMATEVISIGPDTTLPEAYRLMLDHNIRRLPVIENGKLIGIVSMSDVYEMGPSEATSLSVWELNYLLAKTLARDIMTREPKTIGPDASMSQAARLMLDHKIGGVPVVDDKNQVVGIVTESDIFKMVANGSEK